MNKLKVFLTVTLALVLSVSAVLAVTMSVDELKELVAEPEMRLGAFPGPDIYSDINIHGNLTTGGNTLVATSTMQIAFSLTSAQVCNNDTIIVNSGCAASTAACSVAASLDITFPATSTLFADCLREEGAETSFWFVNASPTAASTTELVAGTGCEGIISGDTGAADTIAGLGVAKITLKRVEDFFGTGGANDCLFITEEFIQD